MSAFSTPSKPATFPANPDFVQNGVLNQEAKAIDVPYPRSRHELELLIVRYRSLHTTKANISEEHAIEQVLYKVSEAQEEYKKKLNDLRSSRRKETTYDQDLLKNQITAVQLLSRNVGLPEELENMFAKKTGATKHFEDAEIKPVLLSESLKKNFKEFGFDDKFTDIVDATQKGDLEYPNREQLITNKITSRIAELEKVPSNIGTYRHDTISFGSPDGLSENIDDLKIKALIELKSLRLLTKQKSIRQNILFSVGSKAHTSVDYLKAHPVTQAAQRSLQIRPKIVNKGTARLAEELEKQQFLEKQRTEHARHVEKIRAIIRHSNEIISSKQDALNQRFSFARSISQLHSQIEKDEGKKLEKTAKQRLAALKSNDEEAYLKLLDQTKDTRITHLLRQTNSFLDSLSEAVRAQQTESKIANGEVPDPTKITDDERENIDYYEVAHSVKEEITKQPSILIGGTLKEYQLKGLQWMVSLYNNHLNGILADEMGLGKTIQSLSLITYLIEIKKQPGPYLVIVPLSTITNWTLEFEKWAPSLKTIIYKGTPTQRKNMSYDVRSGNFNVLLTTFEYIIKDRPLLSKLKWVHMIIDEGHRMKNAQSKLSSTLSSYYHTKNRLILTGTPLQNNLPELWALLNFVLPKVFNSVKTFDEWFNTPFANTGGYEKMELSEEETLLIIRRLHKVLRPFLLRRLKKEVEKDLPDKVEKVVKCKLSGLQYVLYQQMLKHNALFVGAGAHGATKSGIKGLNNKIMQLRKICNHPYVFEEVENVVNPTHASSDLLWRSSGKFELLDRVLPKFKETGHRVLMFFQMTQVMDIMEDYLRYRAMKYLRLDGSTKADDRTDMLKVFNDPNSEYFCFLLSTRAGGLGLNLQTADTVIIFDTDWNPHQDLQAQDRAHRIGQKNEVRILRLITTDTVEEVILERALQKLDIDGKVIQAGKFDNKSTSEEQEAFLKKLLENDGQRNDDEKEELDDDELNEILARNDDEKELFGKMDLERATREKIASRKEDGWKERLLTKAELPKIFEEDISRHLEQETKELGRTREKKRVYYDDGLTEEQWLDAMDNDQDSVEAAIERKRAAKERRSKRSSGRVSEEPVSDRRSKRSRSSTLKDPSDDENDFEGSEESSGGSKKAKKGLPDFAIKALEILDYALEAKADDDHRLADYFVELPSKKLYPDYYQLIPQPTSINTIKRDLKSGKLKTFQAFKDSVSRIISNAKFYNEEGSVVYQDAVELDSYIKKKMAEA